MVHWHTNYFQMVVNSKFSKFLVLKKNSKVVWVGTRVIPRIMLSHARSWRMRVCIPSYVWLGITWKIMGRSILSLYTTMALWIQSLGRSIRTIVWVFHIAKICKEPILWAHCHMKKHLGGILPNNLFHMCERSQFYLNSMYEISLHFVGMDVKRATSI